MTPSRFDEHSNSVAVRAARAQRHGHAAVIGSPVAHSLSPAIHAVAFNDMGIAWRFRAIETSPEELATVFDDLRAGRMDALSVTMPHKDAVVSLVDEVSDDALLLRAVNCVFTVDGRIVGVNTDGDGARDALIHQGGVDLAGAVVVVLGAGGTARAVTLALLRAGARCHIMNRTRTKAEGFAQSIASVFPQLASQLIAEQPAWSDVDVVVNATSVGMNSDETPLSSESMHRAMTVLDAVYQPLETRLLREARTVGARCVDGLWMLIHQAKSQQQHWFGRSGSAEAMRKESLMTLERRSH